MAGQFVVEETIANFWETSTDVQEKVDMGDNNSMKKAITTEGHANHEVIRDGGILRHVTKAINMESAATNNQKFPTSTNKLHFSYFAFLSNRFL